MMFFAIVIVATIIILLEAPSVRRGEWVRFKYSENAEYNDLVTAEWLDSLLGLV